VKKASNEIHGPRSCYTTMLCCFQVSLLQDAVQCLNDTTQTQAAGSGHRPTDRPTDTHGQTVSTA